MFNSLAPINLVEVVAHSSTLTGNLKNKNIFLLQANTKCSQSFLAFKIE